MKRVEIRFLFQPEGKFEERAYVKLAHRIYRSFDNLGYDDAEIIDSTDVSTESDRLQEITVGFDVENALTDELIEVLENEIDDDVTNEDHMFIKCYPIITRDK